MKNKELIELLIETALQDANAPLGNAIEVLSPLNEWACLEAFDHVTGEVVVSDEDGGEHDCENARDLDILKVNETWQAKNGQHVLSVDVRDAGKTRVITMRANRIARINGEDARVIKTWTAPEKNEAREAMETGDWGKFFDSLSSLK